MRFVATSGVYAEVRNGCVWGTVEVLKTVNLRLATLVLIVAAIPGCNDTAQRTDRTMGAPPAAAPAPAGPQDAIAAALQSLQVAGIPEAPLKPGVTRSDRERYLLATAKAVEALRFFGKFDGTPPPPPLALGAPNRTEEVAALAPVFAVELADAIDRSDPARAANVLRSALSYGDYVAAESVAGGITAGTVADYLTMAIRTTSKQIDQSMNEALRQSLAPFAARTGIGTVARNAEIARLQAWVGSLQPDGPAVPLESVLRTVREAGARKPIPPEIGESLVSFTEKHSQKTDSIPAAVIVDEAKMAVGIAVSMLENFNKQVSEPILWPTIDVVAHPVASLYFAPINPYSNQASEIGALREEGIRMIELAIRLSHLSQLPADLRELGDDSVSPYNSQVYRFHLVEGGYELTRPRENLTRGVGS